MATLAAEKREGTGKYAAFALRKEGKIPAVLYGRGRENTHIAVSRKEFDLLMERGDRLIDLELDGATQPTVLRDVQHATIGDEVIHVDFRIVEADTRIQLHVPLQLEGQAVGTPMGGRINQVLYQALVECRPSDLPDRVLVDIRELWLGDILHIDDLTPPEGVVFKTPGNVAVVQCQIPRAMKGKALPERPAKGEKPVPVAVEAEDAAADGEAGEA